MSRSRVVHHLLCFILFFGVLSGLGGDRVVLAAQENSNGLLSLPPNQEEQPPPEETLELSCKYPVLSGKSGESFEFEVEIKYQGKDRRRFDLSTTVPPDWLALVVSSYPEKQIPAIEIGPAESYPTTEKVTVNFGPLFWEPPEPGEYVVTLEVSSGNLKQAIELKVKVTARYEFDMDTATGRLNTEVTAGEDNHLSIQLENLGTAAIENITFSSSKPEGWSITFSPEKVDPLEPELTQEVDVLIKPHRKTIAGDYMVTLRAESKEFSPDPLQLRVTVLTPTIWGWVGILIVLAVIAGVGVIFWRLGRR